MLGLEINYYKLWPNAFSSEHLENKLDIAHTKLHIETDMGIKIIFPCSNPFSL